MLYERILAESQRLQHHILNLEKKLKSFPDGKLFIVQNKKYFKWFQSDGHKQQYIYKKNRNLAEQLATKKFYSQLIEDLSHEKKALDFYLRHHRSDYGKAENLLLSPGYQELLSPYFKPQSQELQEWMNSLYETNKKFPEMLTHKTSSGHFVRSKSEAIIDMLLYINKIPFRYECALSLGSAVLYPDFTIRHPKTGETFYWEHFGRMDDPLYNKKVGPTLQLYISHSIIPSINLITTYETSDHPLSSETIEKIVIHYFL